MNAIELFVVPCQTRKMTSEQQIDFIRKNLTKPIVLVGLMGVGKSSIGKALASVLMLEFVDSDNVIEGQERRVIADIFANSGESYFRELERQTLINLAQEGDVKIIGTGGGAFINDQTRQVIQENTLSLFLKAELDILVKRVGMGIGRPLFAGKNPKDVLSSLIDVRYPIYNDAHIIVESEDEPIKETLNRVLETLYSHLSAS